jgi:hypothetical protein
VEHRVFAAFCADCEDAEAAFLHALELAPEDDSALFNLAVLYANHGMEEEVRSTLQQLLQVAGCVMRSPAAAAKRIIYPGEPRSRGRPRLALALSFLMRGVFLSSKDIEIGSNRPIGVRSATKMSVKLKAVWTQHWKTFTTYMIHDEKTSWVHRGQSISRRIFS